jgi:hypothetical protein
LDEETIVTYLTQTHSSATDGGQPDQQLVEAVRDLLADCYGEQIAALAPIACDNLNAQYRKTTDLADKAALRGAIQVLTKHIQPLRTELARELRARFDAKLNAPDDALSHTGRFSLEALKLMEHLGMQEEFELEQSVEQLKKACQDEMSKLSNSISRLLVRGPLPESHNPVFPRVLARSLLQALSGAGCDPSVKRAAYRALCPLLVEVAPYLYEQANSMLALGGRKLAGEYKVPRHLQIDSIAPVNIEAEVSRA